MKISYVKNPVKLFAAVLLLTFAQQSAVYADGEQQCRGEIQNLLNSYQQALNDSDTNKVIPLYTGDGIFIAVK